MGLLWTVIIGFLVGIIARAVMPGQIMGIIMTTLLGVGGGPSPATPASCSATTRLANGGVHRNGCRRARDPSWTRLVNK